MMKAKILSLTALFIFGATMVFAYVKSEKIKVNGNCGMCKNRIEKAVNSIEGIESASWKIETQELAVKFDDQKSTTLQIQTSVAMAGHDTEMFSADDKKYAELPGCCKYQRDEDKKTMNHDKVMQGCNHGADVISSCGSKSSKSGSCCEK